MIYQNTSTKKSISDYMTRMFTKVGISIIATFLISFSLAKFMPKLAMSFFCSLPMILLIAIGEITVLYIMSNNVRKSSLSNINILFSLFVILNSFGITYIYFLFSLAEIMFAALAAGIFFISMGLYGYFTRKDLSNWGSILNVALLSIVGVSLLHMIFSLFTGQKSSMIEILVSMATIVVISLHTAYEMNRYKEFYRSNSHLKEGLVTLGAVNLYLNYIVLFKHILRLLKYARNDNDR